MDYVTKKATIFNGNTHSVEVLERMIEERYTFSSVYIDNYVYVLGGRTYGDDSVAIKA